MQRLYPAFLSTAAKQIFVPSAASLARLQIPVRPCSVGDDADAAVVDGVEDSETGETAEGVKDNVSFLLHIDCEFRE